MWAAKTKQKNILYDHKTYVSWIPWPCIEFLFKRWSACQFLRQDSPRQRRYRPWFGTLFVTRCVPSRSSCACSVVVWEYVLTLLETRRSSSQISQTPEDATLGSGTRKEKNFTNLPYPDLPRRLGRTPDWQMSRLTFSEWGNRKNGRENPREDPDPGKMQSEGVCSFCTLALRAT